MYVHIVGLMYVVLRNDDVIVVVAKRQRETEARVEEDEQRTRT